MQLGFPVLQWTVGESVRHGVAVSLANSLGDPSQLLLRPSCSAELPVIQRGGGGIGGIGGGAGGALTAAAR